MRRSLALLTLLTVLIACGTPETQPEEEIRHVTARVQTQLGGPLEETQMAVHAVPVDPAKVTAGEAGLDDSELVLGVIVEGQPVAYPIRYLAMYEVVNDSVGSTPLTPTW